MKRITLYHSIQSAHILIVSPTAGCLNSTVPLTVAAIVAWFLSCVPAMALGVILFKQVVSFRRWLRGWREDLAMMGLALSMTARLEFA